MGSMRFSRIAGVASVLVLAGSLIGCTAGSTTPSGSQTPTETGTGGAPVASTEIFRYGAATDGGKNLNPITVANQIGGFYLIPVYDTLTQVNEAGEVIPGLATKWAWSADGLTLTLDLRDDVVFHDGTPFDADAVKKYLDKARTAETSTLLGDLGSISAIEVVSDLSLTITTKTPNAALLSALSGRSGMIVAPNSLEAPDLDRYPVGTGPYKVTAHEPGISVTYEKFADYWDHRADTVAGIEMLIQLDPDARVRSALTGELDLTTVNKNQITSAEQQGAEVIVAEAPTIYMIYVNKAKNPAMADSKVRQAISTVIDRQSIDTALMGGLCAPTQQVFPTNKWFSGDVNVAEADVVAAKKLMADSEFPDGFTLSLASVNVPPLSTMAEALVEQLAPLGIDVQLEMTEPAQVVPGFTKNQAYDTYLSAWPGGPDPAMTVNSLLMPTGTFNPGGYENTEISALALEGITEFDQKKRATIYQEIATIASSEALQIPLCQAMSAQIIAPGVSGVTTLAPVGADFRHVVIDRAAK